jgi:ATP-dependent Clp protease ATP-binding subunit ClpC
MFERFSDRARKVMIFANQEAHRIGHDSIGSEHVLLGLLREGSGTGLHVIKQLGVDVPQLRASIESKTQPGRSETAPAARLPPDEGAKAAIAGAISEARLLGHNYVGTEHVLLGLLTVPSCLAAKALGAFGVSLEKTRAEVQQLLGSGAQHDESDMNPVALGMPSLEEWQTMRSHVQRLMAHAREIMRMIDEIDRRGTGA